MKRNKILSAVLVIAMLFSILTVSTIFGSPDIVHPGDINRDGYVDDRDALALREYLAGDEYAIVVPTTTTMPPAMPQILTPDGSNSELQGTEIPFTVGSQIYFEKRSLRKAIIVNSPAECTIPTPSFNWFRMFIEVRRSDISDINRASIFTDVPPCFGNGFCWCFM